MCGIVCYVGKRPAAPLLLDGLKRLEYRGYDSAGLAVQGDKGTRCIKSVGKIEELQAKLNNEELPGQIGIAHTRWATHGKVTEENAHPQTDDNGRIFVIHNGIIENYQSLKEELAGEGHKFKSQTDTEVLPHLIEREMSKNGNSLRDAVRKALRKVDGTFGMCILSSDHPGQVIVARRGSPIVIGVGSDEYFAASDVSALRRYTDQVIYLEDNEMAVLTLEGFEMSTFQNERVARSAETVEWEPDAAEKQGYPHFMLKEIFEQPETLKNALRGRLVPGEGVPKLGGLVPVWEKLMVCRHLIIVSCGTSYFAGLVGRYVFEELTDMLVEVELASEFRYRSLNFRPDTAVLAISQSGETADTLAALREARRKGATLLGMVNVVGSTIARETDAGIYIHAGPEIGVASTKVFTAQLALLTCMALLIGRHQRLPVTYGIELIKALEDLPAKVARVLRRADRIEAAAQKFHKYDNFLFLGRRYLFPIALEGALKLKEISYIHAEGYAAGEMKHGPIALIDENFPTVALVPRIASYDKMVSNLQEVKTRNGPVIAVATEGDDAIHELADEIITIPESHELLTPILATVSLQLFAYYCAGYRGCEIDKPRNLAKSVTVE
ncbi:MAG: glutamine--fructose-6-phosphate transaminase (isomerizing) [Deltaproteobacteria bacterium]|nr:glutamine--fructose-6-phosphate transaminase (isomerizing) [Deltaproteobacteria bacterium]